MTDLEWTAPKSEIDGVQIKEGIVTLVEKVTVNGVPLADVLTFIWTDIEGRIPNAANEELYRAVLRALAGKGEE